METCVLWKAAKIASSVAAADHFMHHSNPPNISSVAFLNKSILRISNCSQRVLKLRGQIELMGRDSALLQSYNKLNEFSVFIE